MSLIRVCDGCRAHQVVGEEFWSLQKVDVDGVVRLSIELCRFCKPNLEAAVEGLPLLIGDTLTVRRELVK